MAAKQSKALAPLMKVETREDRARIVRDLEASWAIEGQHATPAEQARYMDFVEGKVSVEDLLAAAKAG